MATPPEAWVPSIVELAPAETDCDSAIPVTSFCRWVWTSELQEGDGLARVAVDDERHPFAADRDEAREVGGARKCRLGSVHVVSRAYADGLPGVVARLRELGDGTFDHGLLAGVGAVHDGANGCTAAREREPWRDRCALIGATTEVHPVAGENPASGPSARIEPGPISLNASCPPPSEVAPCYARQMAAKEGVTMSLVNKAAAEFLGTPLAGVSAAVAARCWRRHFPTWASASSASRSRSASPS